MLFSNTVAVTNGDELYVETWDEQANSYMALQELLNYLDLVNANNYKYIAKEPFIYKRRKYEDFHK